jgi:hypothetical protein
MSSISRTERRDGVAPIEEPEPAVRKGRREPRPEEGMRRLS